MDRPSGQIAESAPFLAGVEGPADRGVESDTPRCSGSGAGPETRRRSRPAAAETASVQRTVRDSERPRLLAMPSPDPAGTTPSVTVVPMSGPAISLIVPSPPHAMTRSAPPATKASLNSRA